MPYKDAEARRRAAREWYRRKYQSDPEFREEEAKRKAEWFEENEERKATMRRYIRGKRSDSDYLADEAAKKRRKRKRKTD